MSGLLVKRKLMNLALLNKVMLFQLMVIVVRIRMHNQVMATISLIKTMDGMIQTMVLMRQHMEQVVMK